MAFGRGRFRSGGGSEPRGRPLVDGRPPAEEEGRNEGSRRTHTSIIVGMQEMGVRRRGLMGLMWWGRRRREEEEEGEEEARREWAGEEITEDPDQ